MIDGIKLHYVATPEEVKKLKSEFEFSAGIASLSLPNTSARRIKAKHRNFTFTIAADRHVTIQGSLHKSFSDGKNYTRFPYSRLVQAVDTLASEIGIQPNRLTIQNMEAGVNILGPPVSFRDIERNLIVYKNKTFSDYKKGGVVFGKYISQQRYMLKVYDKSIQEKLSFEVLRAELKVVKSLHLHDIGLQTMADLKQKNYLHKLGSMIVKHFSHVLMNDVAAMQLSKLPPKDRERYLLGSNPLYWKGVSGSTTHKQRGFRKLIDSYGGVNLTEILIAAIAEEWICLLNG